MGTKMTAMPSASMRLDVEIASEIMRPNPISIRDNATIREAVALLSDKGFSAAPVINAAGHPVGVVSRSDILVHDREKIEYVTPVPDYYEAEVEEVHARTHEFRRGGFQVVDVDRALVSDIMTPVVFSVVPETPVRKVLQEMLSLKVHRLFVVDDDGVLVGVISATDLLRHLR
jgi:CBS domain-containing protein